MREVGYGLFLLVIAAAVAFMNWTAWRMWHDPAVFDRYASKPGLERLTRGQACAVAVQAAWLDEIFLVTPVFLAVEPARPLSAGWLVARTLFLATMCAGPPLILSIILVNRPRCLVVPHQRHLTWRDLADDARRARPRLNTRRMPSKGRRRRGHNRRSQTGRRAGR